MRSADECEMSRSCQSGTFSKPTTAAARTTRARPEIRSATFGLRLCGIADEPFIPVANGSSTSRTSVRARWRISVAKRSSEVAQARARRAARHGGRARSPASTPAPARGRAARMRSARPRDRLRIRADRARELADAASLERTLEPVPGTVELEGPAGELPAERRRLGVDRRASARCRSCADAPRPAARRRPAPASMPAGDQRTGVAKLSASAVSTTSEDVRP